MTSAIERRDGKLFCEDYPLEQIAAEFGTPSYIYSRRSIETAFKAYQNALTGRQHLICYAVKANSSLAVINCLGRLGAGFDVVSRGELERVIAAGGDPSRVVFSGVAKTADEMQRALEVGIRCFNVESAHELETLADVARQNGQVAPISVRVNPDVDARTHPYISTGLKENKFGVAPEEALAMYQRAATLPSLNPVGIDCHIGSQLLEVAPFSEALDCLLDLLDRIEALGINLKHLDIGGGLGVSYRDETPPAIEDYIAQLLTHLGNRPLELILEPGRSLVAMAGLLLTRVIALKPGPHKNFALVDAGMNDLLRPALYSAWQDIVPVSLGDATPRVWDVVGPICETGDFLGKERELALSGEDLLAVTGAGAYGFVMASNYNSRGRPPEIMVDGDKAHLIRPREQLQDLWHTETLLPES